MSKVQTKDLDYCCPYCHRYTGNYADHLKKLCTEYEYSNINKGPVADLTEYSKLDAELHVKHGPKKTIEESDIYTMTPEDVPEVAKLWREMSVELEPDSKPDVGWWIKQILKHLEVEGFRMFIAVDEVTEQIVGFLSGMVYPEPLTGKVHVAVQHLYVKPDYRKGSILMELYRAAVEFAKEKGVENIDLHCSVEQAPMWVKQGFESTGIIMRRAI